jgi:hypothetical protein
MKSLLNKTIYFSFEQHLKKIFWTESAFGFAVSVENYSNLISICPLPLEKCICKYLS